MNGLCVNKADNPHYISMVLKVNVNIELLVCSCEWHEFIVLFGRKGSELIHLHTTYQMFLDIDQPSMHRKLSIQLWLCDLHSYGIQLLKVCDGIPFEDMKKIRKNPTMLVFREE